jgi:hypothetical protein
MQSVIFVIYLMLLFVTAAGLLAGLFIGLTAVLVCFLDFPFGFAVLITMPLSAYAVVKWVLPQILKQIESFDFKDDSYETAFNRPVSEFDKIPKFEKPNRQQ